MYFAGQHTQSPRQSWLLRGACLALFMLISACGFTLRGVTPLPFETLYVGIADNTQFGADVRRALRAASPDTKLVTSPKDAQAILQEVCRISGVSYTDGASKTDVSIRIITDHIRRYLL